MRKVIVSLFQCILKWVYEKYLTDTYEGIKICDWDHNGHYIRQALELVKERDMRRFRRIQKRLAYIVNGNCIGGGEYDHHLKVCCVDLARFDFASDETWYVLQLACALVHEATHGEIQSHKIVTNNSNFRRVEHLCHQEENRFFARVRPDDPIPEFDPTWWEEYRKLTSWQRGIQLFKRMRTAESKTVDA